MATIVTRSGKGSPLTHAEVDANFENLNNDKVEASSLATVATSGAYADLSGTPTLATVATTGAYSDLSGLPTLGAENKIINGNFGINQRSVSGTVTLTAGSYGHDRWKAGASGCTYTFATSANVTTITISAGTLVQVIEGLNLQSGTHVLSWTGTIQMTIDGGSAGNSGMTGTLTGGTNATVETSGTGTLSLVQLEKGDTATAFKHRSYGQELALCQRYYQLWSAAWTGVSASSGYVYSASIVFHTEMRATPTLGVVSQTNSARYPSTSYTTAGTTKHGTRASYIAQSAGGNETWTVTGSASAEL